MRCGWTARVSDCLQAGSFTQNSLVSPLHKSPSHHAHLRAALLTNGAVLPGDVSVVCLEGFGGLPGTWKALAEEKPLGFRLGGRGAGGAGAVIFGVSGRLWAVSLLPFGRRTRGLQGGAGDCRGVRVLVIRGGTVPADAWIGSCFPKGRLPFQCPF